MKTSHAILIAALVLLGAVAVLEARTWTSSDGRQIEADFVSATGTTVTIRKDGRDFTLSIDKLSEEDRAFVAEKLAAAREFDMAALGDKTGLFKGEWVKADHAGMPYQIFAPAKLEKDRPLPLVVFLHGIGECGADGEKQMNDLPKRFATPENFKARPCVIIAPQCAVSESWSSGGGDRVISLVKELAKSPAIDNKRIYLGGFSMGGYGTWSLLAKEPKLFACGFPIAGGADPEIATAIRKIPIWNFHGDADQTVNVEGSRRIVEALKKKNGKIIHTELPGEGHGIAGKVLRDQKLQEWIFAQKKE